MRPDLFSIGDFTLHSFGLMMAVGFLVSGYLLSRAMADAGDDPAWAWEVLIAAAIGGVAGAKINYAIQEGGGESLFGGAGLIWYGGVIGGAIAVVLVGLWRRIPLGRLANMSAPSLAIGYAIGRIGCQLAGDGDYGRATDLPWGMSYPEGEVPTTEIVHPTPVYETLAMTVAFYVLWRLRTRLTGPWELFGLWAIFAGLERFLVEFVRRNDDVALGLTTAQFISLALALVGVGLWSYGRSTRLRRAA